MAKASVGAVEQQSTSMVRKNTNEAMRSNKASDEPDIHPHLQMELTSLLVHIA